MKQFNQFVSEMKKVKTNRDDDSVIKLHNLAQEYPKDQEKTEPNLKKTSRKKSNYVIHLGDNDGERGIIT